MHGSYCFLHGLIWRERGKFMKEEAAIKCDGEGDDNDARRRLG
jgi:hypothetical protein